MRFGTFSSVIHGEFKRSLDCRVFNSYKVRFARLQDLPFIRNCNLENLPENYTDNFYYQQIRNWPKLSLLCEDSQENVVAYALGRILHNHQAGNPLFPSANTNNNNSAEQLQQRKVEHDYGHVLSLAVNKNHRGMSIAKEMMNFMHMQLAANYDINSIDLYCRESNKCAIKLYKSFGYEITSHEKAYYKDGEDAYRMQLLDFVSYYAYVGEEVKDDIRSNDNSKSYNNNDLKQKLSSAGSGSKNVNSVTAMNAAAAVIVQQKKNAVNVGNAKSVVIGSSSTNDNRNLYDRVFNTNNNKSSTTAKTNGAAAVGSSTVTASKTVGSVFPTGPASSTAAATIATATNGNVATSLWSLPNFNNNRNNNRCGSTNKQ